MCFVPVTTVQGLTSSEARSLVAGRDAYIWGLGPVSRDVFISLQKSAVDVRGFLDSRARMLGRTFLGLPIVNPDAVLSTPLPSRGFVVVASESYGRKAETFCRDAQLEKGRDYINYRSVARPTAVVDVSGMCDLRCPCCVRGSDLKLRPNGLMSYRTYENVLEKLTSDMPLLTMIELSAWGEPLLNPDLPKIVAITEKCVPACVSTNLKNVEGLEELIKARPTELHVTINGCESCYERMMAGATWRELSDNLHLLGALAAKHHFAANILLKAYAYDCDTDAQKQHFLEMAARLNLRVQFCTPYLSPYDRLLSYVESNEWSCSDELAVRSLTWDVDRALSLARRDIGRPCLCQRIFPIINWDLSVGQCHVFHDPVVSPNYLETDWDELLSLRHGAPHCRVCQKHGLHRLDLEVLAVRHGHENIMNTRV